MGVIAEYPAYETLGKGKVTDSKLGKMKFGNDSPMFLQNSYKYHYSLAMNNEVSK